MFSSKENLVPQWVDSLPTVAWHTFVVYIALIVLLRWAGQRQLGQLSVIDLVIIIVLGSAVESSMISGNVSLPGGFVAAGTLLLTNRLLTALVQKNRSCSRLLMGEPILLVHDGKLEMNRLHRIGLTLDELIEAIRQRGYKSLQDVKFCVMETDGEINVIPNDEQHFRGSHDIRKPKEASLPRGSRPSEKKKRS
jgi:uncharacterized membrane protein YcaP (DUF421 family)